MNTDHGLVSLVDSEDQLHYSLVASAAPVTFMSNSVRSLRELLVLPVDEPSLDHVLEHLLNLMRDGGILHTLERARKSTSMLYAQVCARRPP